jgi:hypothetical protein
LNLSTPVVPIPIIDEASGHADCTDLCLSPKTPRPVARRREADYWNPLELFRRKVRSIWCLGNCSLEMLGEHVAALQGNPVAFQNFTVNRLVKVIYLSLLVLRWQIQCHGEDRESGP